MSAKAKIITLIVVFLLAMGVSVYGIVTGDEEIREEIPRMIVVAISFAAVIVKVATGQGSRRRSLSFYENHYKKELENAFFYEPKKKKRLLEATRFYDENKYKKSLKILKKLKNECDCWEDCCAVGLFMGLCYTDMGHVQDAYNTYNELIDRVEANDTVYLNMGHLLQTVYQEEDRAVECYQKALQLNPNNPIIYNNLASLQFDTGDWDEAITNAKKALEINSKTYQAASLLAIMYACEGNDEESAKYFAVAVSGGANKVNLKKAVEYYK
ncbi:MAG: tetratricopeptide repeat protein [Clostridia bacterium]|nr:tetratricopeptide repeat protein [Clostridia bacterium]